MKRKVRIYTDLETTLELFEFRGTPYGGMLTLSEDQARFLSAQLNTILKIRDQE